MAHAAAATHAPLTVDPWPAGQCVKHHPWADAGCWLAQAASGECHADGAAEKEAQRNLYSWHLQLFPPNGSVLLTSL